MKTLREIAPELTPEQIAECGPILSINWETRKARLVLTNASGIVAVKELNNTTAPIPQTQEQY